MPGKQGGDIGWVRLLQGLVTSSAPFRAISGTGPTLPQTRNSETPLLHMRTSMTFRLTPVLCVLMLAGCASSEPQSVSYAPPPVQSMSVPAALATKLAASAGLTRSGWTRAIHPPSGRLTMPAARISEPTAPARPSL